MISSPEGLTLINLVDASQDQLRVFAEQIKQADGLLNGVIHPFFERPSRPHVLPFISTPRYNSARDNWLQQILVDSPEPTLFFEEAEKLLHLPERLAKYKGVAYVIDTLREKPQPARISWDRLAEVLHVTGVKRMSFGGLVIHWSPSYSEDEDWNLVSVEDREVTTSGALKLFREKASEIAVRQGRPLAAAHDWIDKGDYPWGCVGVASTKLLMRGIDTSFVPAVESD